MKLNLTIRIVIILCIISINTIFSQKSNLIKVGDIVLNQNVRIGNNMFYYFTEEGVCYGIDCKYKNTTQNDLEEIKNIWSSNWVENEDGSNKKSNGTIAFDTPLCSAREGNYSYRLGFDYLDVDEQGIVLIGRYIGIESTGMIPAKTEIGFNSLDEFLTNSDVLEMQAKLKTLAETKAIKKELKKKELEKSKFENDAKQKVYDSTPIEEIILPYNLNFNLSEIELANKLKINFNDKLIKSKKQINNNSLGIYTTEFYVLNAARVLELTLTVSFYKNKAYSYSYFHDNWDLDFQFQKKRRELTLKYNKIYNYYKYKTQKEVEENFGEPYTYKLEYELEDGYDNSPLIRNLPFIEIAISDIKKLIIREENAQIEAEEKIKKSKYIGNKM